MTLILIGIILAVVFAAIAYSAAPGGFNVYVPTFDPATTGGLQVEFTRQVNSFALTKYVQVIPVQDKIGLYLKIDTDEAVRVVNESDYEWPEGTDSPRGAEAGHHFEEYRTSRKAYAFKVPHAANRLARWDLVPSHARIKAQLAMTHRSLRAATVIGTAGNWPTGSTGTATATGGGVWLASSETNSYIQKSIDAVVDAITLNTGGAVSAADIIMVVGPPVARVIAQSPEYKSYFKAAEQALRFVMGTAPVQEYQMVGGLFGIGGMVVENAVRLTGKKKARGATNTGRGFLLDDSAVFVSRPGGLVGVPGAPTFATVCMFTAEDLSTEAGDDTWNRRILGRVTTQDDFVLVAPKSGFLLTDCITA